MWQHVANPRREPMDKKHVVSLTKGQREIAQNVVDRLDGSPRKVKRAQMLLKADERSGGWTDKQIAEAFSCTTKTVENVRQRYCESGFDVALSGKQRLSPPRERKFDGDGEAAVIALRLSEPPKGYANWTLDLLQERVVMLSIVPSVSRETLRMTLKKME
jgi:transposase